MLALLGTRNGLLAHALDDVGRGPSCATPPRHFGALRVRRRTHQHLVVFASADRGETRSAITHAAPMVYAVRFAG